MATQVITTTLFDSRVHHLGHFPFDTTRSIQKGKIIKQIKSATHSPAPTPTTQRITIKSAFESTWKRPCDFVRHCLHCPRQSELSLIVPFFVPSFTLQWLLWFSCLAVIAQYASVRVDRLDINLCKVSAKRLSRCQWFLISAAINKTHDDERHSEQRTCLRSQNARMFSVAYHYVSPPSPTPYLFHDNLRLSISTTIPHTKLSCVSPFPCPRSDKNPRRIEINARPLPKYTYISSLICRSCW